MAMKEKSIRLFPVSSLKRADDTKSVIPPPQEVPCRTTRELVDGAMSDVLTADAEFPLYDLPAGFSRRLRARLEEELSGSSGSDSKLDKPGGQ